MGSYSEGMGQGMDYLALPPGVNICLNRDGLILQDSHIPAWLLFIRKNISSNFPSAIRIFIHNSVHLRYRTI